MSPPPWSCQPLAWSIGRVRSRRRSSSATEVASNWPHPSLKGTQTRGGGRLALWRRGAPPPPGKAGGVVLGGPAQPVGAFGFMEPGGGGPRPGAPRGGGAAPAVGEVLPHQHAEAV